MVKKSIPANQPPQGILPTTDFRREVNGVQMAFKAGIVSSPIPYAVAEALRNEGLAAPKDSPVKAMKTAADTAE